MAMDRIAVLGAGAWGTALAYCAAGAGAGVVLWGRDAAAVERIATRRENSKLPGVRLEDGILPTSDLNNVADADAVLVVVPAQAVRDVTVDLAGLLADATPIVACAKGIERGTHKFMTEVIAECAPTAMPA